MTSPYLLKPLRQEHEVPNMRCPSSGRNCSDSMCLAFGCQHLPETKAQGRTVATECITGHLTGTQDAGRGILSSEAGPRPEATGKTRVGSPQFHPAPETSRPDSPVGIATAGVSAPRPSDTPAPNHGDRISEWLEYGSIRCPADPDGGRCFHTLCIEHGCAYTDPAAGKDGMSHDFERTS